MDAFRALELRHGRHLRTTDTKHYLGTGGMSSTGVVAIGHHPDIAVSEAQEVIATTVKYSLSPLILVLYS